MVGPTPGDLLDLDTRAARQETFRFDVLDRLGNVIGSVDVDADHPPSITNDVAATNLRQMQGFRISPADIAGINTLTDRIRPVHIFGPGGTGFELPLGVFVFADDDDDVRSFGALKECSLTDQTIDLAQILAESVSYPAGTGIADALAAEATAAGSLDFSIDSSSLTVGAPIVGAAGKDTRLTVMQSLCTQAGFFQPYYDNDGTLICRAVPDLAVANPDHVYNRGTGSTGRVVANSVHSANGLLSAPNRYIATDTSATNIELVGVYNVPDTAPHSFANTGRLRVRSESIQGLESQAAANAAAAAIYAQDSGVFASLTFNTPIDSRHDTFDIVESDLVDGTSATYIEHEWRMECRPGAEMEHDVRRIYI